MLPRALVLTAAVLACAASARAQTRPLSTEEATTAPAGTLTLEVGAQAIRAQPNPITGRPRDTWDGPLFRLVWSPADRVEMDLEWVARVGAREDPDFGSVSDYGDVSLRAKVRLAGEEGGRHALAGRFTVTLPETSFGNGLGPNVLRMTAQLLATATVAGTALHANAGLGLHDEVLRPHEQRDFLAYGIAVVRPVGRVDVVAEVAGLAGSGQPGADAHHEARAGLRLRTGRAQWDAAVRRGLGAADGRWGVTAGARFSLR